MRPLFSLPLLVAVTLFVLLVFAPSGSNDDIDLEPAPLRQPGRRALSDLFGSSSDSSTPTSTSSSADSTTTAAASSSSTTSSSSATSSADTPTSSPAGTTTTPANQASSTPLGQAPASASPSSILTTNSAGSTVVVFESVTASAPSASSSAPANNSNNNSDSGVSSSTIIGLAVAGGVAVLGIIAFFVWKFTHKRFSDLDDTIKWPELNAHNNESTNALSATGGDAFGGAALSRTGSRTGGGYAGSIAATSTTELYGPGGAADPYAVPPLPQFNPAQPYRDDPHAFYDPYRGPVPTTFDGGAEAIPMTQLAAGRRSPGPGAAFGAPQQPGAYGSSDYGAAAAGYGADPYGAAAPAPYAAAQRTGSPAPYGARSGSPGPQAAYGERARSPGPGAVMAAGGRASPAPSAGGYGAGYPR